MSGNGGSLAGFMEVLEPLSAERQNRYAGALERDVMTESMKNKRALKEKYKSAYLELSRLVEEADPIQLIGAGAPTDEYGPEVASILSRGYTRQGQSRTCNGWSTRSLSDGLGRISPGRSPTTQFFQKTFGHGVLGLQCHSGAGPKLESISGRLVGIPYK